MHRKRQHIIVIYDERQFISIQDKQSGHLKNLTFLTKDIIEKKKFEIVIEQIGKKDLVMSLTGRQ